MEIRNPSDSTSWSTRRVETPQTYACCTTDTIACSERFLGCKILKLLRELRRALVELLVDDLEHQEAHRRIAARIQTLTISSHTRDRTGRPET